MISCLLLCAGQSSRFGKPKALATIDGQVIIQRTLNTLILSPIERIIVVTGAWAQEINPYVLNHNKVSVVHNKYHENGQTSSVQAGINTLPSSTEYFFLYPVDYPLIQASTITSLLNNKNTNADIIIPTFNNKRGHPPLFKRTTFNTIEKLPHTQGINTIFQEFNIEHIPVNDPGVLKTFNTPEEFLAIIK